MSGVKIVIKATGLQKAAKKFTDGNAELITNLSKIVRKYAQATQAQAVKNVSGTAVNYSGGTFTVNRISGTLARSITVTYPSKLSAVVEAGVDYADAIEGGVDHPVDLKMSLMGKCLGAGTPVLMFDGSVNAVEDVVVGDQLMGPDSKPRNVLALGNGRGKLHRVHQSRGLDSYVVNDDHILSVKYGVHREPFNISVRDFYARCGQSKGFKKAVKGYSVAIDFPGSPVPLEPYFMGIWLGDGCSRTQMITTADNEVVEYLSGLAERYGLPLNRYPLPNNKASNYSIVGCRGRTHHPIKRSLSDLGVLQNKHIPAVYLKNDRATRLQVLAGLVDSDGNCHQGEAYVFTLKSEQLAIGLAALARSLGFRVSKCLRRKAWQFGFGHYHHIYISGDLREVPVRLPRKKCREPRLLRGHHDERGISLEPIGEGEYFGFHIDGDGLFLLGDYTVTHNTVFIPFATATGNRDTAIQFPVQTSSTGGNNAQDPEQPIKGLQTIAKTSSGGKSMGNAYGIFRRIGPNTQGFIIPPRLPRPFMKAAAEAIEPGLQAAVKAAVIAMGDTTT